MLGLDAAVLARGIGLEGVRRMFRDSTVSRDARRVDGFPPGNEPPPLVASAPWEHETTRNRPLRGKPAVPWRRDGRYERLR